MQKAVILTEPKNGKAIMSLPGRGISLEVSGYRQLDAAKRIAGAESHDRLAHMIFGGSRVHVTLGNQSVTGYKCEPPTA